MLSVDDDETYGTNKDPRPRHISPEETKSFNMNAGRESLRRKLRKMLVKNKINRQLLFVKNQNLFSMAFPVPETKV